MVSNGPGENDLVTGPDRLQIHCQPRHRASDASGRDVHAVRFAVLNHFRISANHRDAGSLEGSSHGANFALENRCWQPLFENKCGNHVLTDGPGHGQIIHGPIDGQFSNGSARKLERLYDKAIGCNCENTTVDPDMRGITKRRF